MSRPWEFPDFSDGRGYPHPAVGAFKALQRGEASPDQQKIALAFIIDNLAGTYEVSYRANERGGDRDTAFAEGRRWVGLMIRAAIERSFDKLPIVNRKQSKPEEEPRG